MHWDIFAGRVLAVCVHPFAAWNVVSRRARCLIATSYFLAGYLATFVGLRFVAL
jgi:hypothetical protein